MADNPTAKTAPDQGSRTYTDGRRGGGRSWPKGVSGNPKGRPPNPPELRELARQHGAEAIEGLAKIATNAKTPPSARIRAFEALLARGYGMPTQPLEHAGTGGEPLTVVIRREELKP